MLDQVMNFAQRQKPSSTGGARYGQPSNDKGHVRIRDVEVIFGQDENAHLAVARTSLEIKPGEFVCLLGPSGCGKSTLLNCIAGYVTPTGGTVTVDGEAIVRPGPDRGMVFQQYSLFPWKTIKENVAFGPKVGGASASGAESLANTFLAMVGLSNFADRYPAELSGGMQQRVGIARALANYPSVLLMDEPFGALDAQTRLMMQENLLGIWSEFRTTVVFVTHDVDEAVFLADRILVMSAAPGHIIADLEVALERPRDPAVATTRAFIEIKKQCLEMIRSESLKAFEQQNR
jgi:NitT/TauT family transport system ATP-binding protein